MQQGHDRDAPRHSAPRVVHVLVPRLLTVHRVTELSRSMRRVTLTGPELTGFSALAATDHVKVFFPADGAAPPVMPVVSEEHWTNRADQRLIYRDYTVRTFRPEQAIDLDMVLHDHGPAGRWAAQAQPGQQLGLLGPRSSTMRPLDRRWYVLAADETGLPATANWLERLPGSARVDVFVEVGAAEDEVDLPAHDGARVTWLHRGTAPPGTSRLLPDAVARCPLGAGPGYVWAAAEASQVRAIRTDLKNRGLDGGSFSTTGYWRLGVANFDHKSPEA